MSINKITALEKGNPLNSTGADIAEAINGIVDYDYSAVKSRFLDALESETPYTYIVTGDSTRESVTVDSLEYYTPQLAKINFTPVNNSGSGRSASDWISNTGSPTLQDAIDATAGTGATTVLEMSLGINSEDGQDEAAVKADIVSGLNTYLQAKPDAVILLVSPVRMTTSWDFDTMYQEIHALFPENSIFISGKKPLDSVYGDPVYYSDDTHPSLVGLKRLINVIFTKALPNKCSSLMFVEDKPLPTPANTTFTTSVLEGFWRTDGGGFVSDTSYRSLDVLDIEPNFVLKIDTGGNQAGCVLYDDQDNFLETIYASTHAGTGGAYRSFVIPPNAYKVRINFSDEGAVWDALSYPIVIDYILSEDVYVPQSRLNQGNFISLPYIANPVIDDSGKVGSVGQVKTSQGDGTWLWV